MEFHSSSVTTWRSLYCRFSFVALAIRFDEKAIARIYGHKQEGE